jgi:hypothetical protein
MGNPSLHASSLVKSAKTVGIPDKDPNALYYVDASVVCHTALRNALNTAYKVHSLARRTVGMNDGVITNLASHLVKKAGIFAQGSIWVFEGLHPGHKSSDEEKKRIRMRKMHGAICDMLSPNPERKDRGRKILANCAGRPKEFVMMAVIAKLRKMEINASALVSDILIVPYYSVSLRTARPIPTSYKVLVNRTLVILPSQSTW